MHPFPLVAYRLEKIKSMKYVTEFKKLEYKGQFTKFITAQTYITYKKITILYQNRINVFYVTFHNKNLLRTKVI